MKSFVCYKSHVFILNEMVVVYSVGDPQQRQVQRKEYVAEVKYITTGGKAITKMVRCKKGGGLYSSYRKTADSIEEAKNKVKEHNKNVRANRPRPRVARLIDHDQE